MSVNDIREAKPLRLTDRIRREILVESGSDLFQSTIEICIQRRYY